MAEPGRGPRARKQARNIDKLGQASNLGEYNRKKKAAPT